MAQYHKDQGYQGEELVKMDYLGREFTLVEQNYTMPGGEIDLIMTKRQMIVFVEVKVVNHIDELHGYVTGKKLHYVRKTIDYFLLQADDKYKDFDLRLDVAFVRDGTVYEIYENVHVS